MKRLFSRASLFLPILLIACTSAEVMDPAPLKAGSSMDTTRDAIARGMAVREWKIKGEKSGEILAEVVVREKHTVAVTIDYDRDIVSFKYASSDNMNYEVASDGTRYIHKNYNAWVNNLRSDIEQQLMLKGSSAGGR